MTATATATDHVDGDVDLSGVHVHINVRRRRRRRCQRPRPGQRPRRRRRPRCLAVVTYFFFVHLVIHAITSSCHSLVFCGLRTQWFSSGKWMKRLGMFLRWSAVKVAMPSVSTTRKSWPPWITRVGVFQLATLSIGSNLVNPSGL